MLPNLCSAANSLFRSWLWRKIEQLQRFGESTRGCVRRPICARMQCKHLSTKKIEGSGGLLLAYYSCLWPSSIRMRLITDPIINGPFQIHRCVDSRLLVAGPSEGQIRATMCLLRTTNSRPQPFPTARSRHDKTSEIRTQSYVGTPTADPVSHSPDEREGHYTGWHGIGYWVIDRKQSLVLISLLQRHRKTRISKGAHGRDCARLLR